MIKQKHQQLFDLLVQELRNGKWPQGTKLPNQKEFAALYSVSVNVVSQAVELLKKADLVKVRKGDGIYSNFTLTAVKSEQKYAGSRLFGHYAGAKKLTVLIEDSMDTQIEHWNTFFHRFSVENPDIELDVHYDHLHATEQMEHCDVAIGGGSFLVKAGAMEHRLSHETAKEFYPDLYDDILLKPENFADGLFPVGYVGSYLWCRPETPKPLPGENMLDYIERTIEPGRGSLLVRQSARLFQNSGINVLNRNRQPFRPEEKEKLHEFFERTSRLYRDGRLCWTLGQVGDAVQVESLVLNGQLIAAEQFGGHAQENGGKTLISMEYPYGEKAMIVPVLAVIDNRTCFPEEPLRLLRALLSERSQRIADADNIQRAIHCKAMDPRSVISDYFKRGALEYRRDFDPVDLGAYYCIFCWEFLFNLTKMRGKDAVEMLDRKIRYYYRTAEKYPEKTNL